jgi:hypothetical protein
LFCIYSLVEQNQELTVAGQRWSFTSFAIKPSHPGALGTQTELFNCYAHFTITGFRRQAFR